MMKTIQSKEVKGIQVPATGVWQVRNNCKTARWAVDASTMITPKEADQSRLHQMDMVVLGYTSFHGIVPAISSWEGLEKQLKMMGIPTQNLSPIDYVTIAQERLAKNWGYVLFVPMPGHLTNPVTLPANTVCGTLIKSTGLNKAASGFLGNKGILDQISLSGGALIDYVITASIEVTHEAPGTGQDVNGVVWSHRLPKDKTEAAFIKEVKAFSEENSQYFDSWLPRADMLRGCVEIDILTARAQERMAAEQQCLELNFAFAPGLIQSLPMLTTVDVNASAVIESGE